MPYLAKGPRPDINNGSGVTRTVPTFWPQHSFKFNSNNGPSPGHSNLGSEGRYTCSSLPLMVWWVPYLNKGCRPDFNNGLGCDSIVAPFWPPGVNLSPTRIMAPTQATPVLCQMKCSGLLLIVSWWLPYLAKGPTPDFNTGPGNDSNIGCTLAFQHLFESNLNNSPSPSHSSLV